MAQAKQKKEGVVSKKKHRGNTKVSISKELKAWLMLNKPTIGFRKALIVVEKSYHDFKQKKNTTQSINTNVS